MNKTPRPYTLIAELTYRCPLRCLYCSNPLAFAQFHQELSTEEWTDIFYQAAQLGVVQLHLSGGEPTVRNDLVQLIRHARESGLYVNLITGGTLLEPQIVREMRQAGLDHIQLSLQGASSDAAAVVTGSREESKKRQIASTIVDLGIPLTLNIVLHRLNVEHVHEMVRDAYSLGAQRLELANVQYYGWALHNRQFLIPSRQQYDAAEIAAREEREAYRGKMDIVFVRNDYIAADPKPCMGGWAQSYICIDPTGTALPCLSARIIPGVRFPNVTTDRLDHIWGESEAFVAFRGEEWMLEPCRSCPRKHYDHGGCRCQAFILTGDARAADPVCPKSTHHQLIENSLVAPAVIKPLYRQHVNSVRFGAGG